MNKRIIIYGDLHGCLDEFISLREKIKPLKSDKEIVIGDILDKGNYSNELLNYIQKHKILSIMGNHEYKYVRYKKHQEKDNKNPIILDDNQLKIYKNLSEENFIYLNSLPFFIKIDNLTLVHAGITNKIQLETASLKDLKKLLWITRLDTNQNPVSLSDENKSSKLWTEYYNGNQGFIIYGHHPFDKVKYDKYSMGIDTGCVHGNKLTACIITNTISPKDNCKIVQESSKKDYIFNG